VTASFLSLAATTTVHPLAHVNAALNALATVLLIVGFVFIKQRRERAHIRTMLAAFAVSVAFLTCYMAYHVWPVGAQATPFRGEGPIRSVYFAVLISHILLAMIVPPLVAVTIFLGLRDLREKHRKLAKFTFPIWLYVSVTGVVVYYMLYQMYPLE
jgi:uncharacterized membrane protein YozB (DUF420 family)